MLDPKTVGMPRQLTKQNQDIMYIRIQIIRHAITRILIREEDIAILRAVRTIEAGRDPYPAVKIDSQGRTCKRASQPDDVRSLMVACAIDDELPVIFRTEQKLCKPDKYLMIDARSGHI